MDHLVESKPIKSTATDLTPKYKAQFHYMVSKNTLARYVQKSYWVSLNFGAKGGEAGEKDNSNSVRLGGSFFLGLPISCRRI